MHFSKLLLKGFSQILMVLVWMQTNAQSVPAVPAEIEFAGVSLQLTPTARQRLQQTLIATYADRALLLNQLETLSQLRPLLDARLNAQKVPLDFRYICLPFTESPYDPYAYWGLRQPLTEQLQLLVNKSVDDRRHVLIATDAVLPYLVRLRQQKGHWIKALFQHLDASAKLPPADYTVNHWLLDVNAPAMVWTVLARKLVFEHEQAPLKLAPAFVLLEYDEGGGKTLSEIAGQLRLNSDRLSPYNTWLLADRIPASGSFPVILRLTPAEYLSVKSRTSTGSNPSTTNNLLASNDLGFPILRRTESAVSRQATILYEINGRRGIQAQLCDNAITLAYYGKLAVPAFLSTNDLPAQEIGLRPGEVYYLQRKAKRAKIPFHVVQPSQTLWDVSAMYGIRLKSLLRYNRIKPNQRVQTGRIIWMQHKRPASTPVEYKQVTQPKNNTPYIPPPLSSDSTALTAPGSPTQAASQGPLTSTTTPATVAIKDNRKDSVAVAKDSVVAIAPVNRPKSVPAAIPGHIAKVHVVKPGQTYFSIARLYGTTVGHLCAWNQVTDSDPLLVGQELLISSLESLPSARQPVASPQVHSVKPGASVLLEKKVAYYTVKPGETVYRIALNHAISVPDLMRWNGLKNFTIDVGQRLIVSSPGN